MANPRKRKGGRQIGRVLNRGTGATESSLSQSEIRNILEIGLYGHDGDQRPPHAISGSLSGSAFDGDGKLAEDNGLETVQALAASDRMNVGTWNNLAKRYMFGSDTTLEGHTEANPAVGTSGILHDPTGPEAEFCPNLDDVSDGTEKQFWIKPTGWADGQSLVFFAQNANSGSTASLGSQTIKLTQGDTDATVKTWTGLAAAGQTHTVAWHAANDVAGVIVEWDNDNTADTVANAGWHVAWKVTE